MIGYSTQHENKLAIKGNMFINNGLVTAYYVLFPYNYSVMDTTSSGSHINRLYTALSTMYSAMGEMKVSLFKLSSVVSKEETIDQIIKTVQMYKKDYTEFPEQYRKYIKNIARDQCILAISVDPKDAVDIENQSAFELLKQMFERFMQENFSTTVVTIDEKAADVQNNRIKNGLQRYAVPASSKLVMNIYINSLYPSYNLVYNDYLLKHASSILAGVQQEIVPHLGWFEMSNSGIVAFGAKSRKTYGAVLAVLELPESIYSESFNIAVPGLAVNMHLLPKDKAVLKFKRMRASALEEVDEAQSAGARDSDVNEHVSLLERALKDIRQGRVVAEVDANILVTADSKEELDRKKKHVISVLADLNVATSIAANQGKTFIQSFVKRRPVSYQHIMDLQYALSFQMDSGVSVGQADSKFAAPVIGIG